MGGTNSFEVVLTWDLEVLAIVMVVVGGGGGAGGRKKFPLFQRKGGGGGAQNVSDPRFSHFPVLQVSVFRKKGLFFPSVNISERGNFLI